MKRSFMDSVSSTVRPLTRSTTPQNRRQKLNGTVVRPHSRSTGWQLSTLAHIVSPV